ncbi:MAG: c-type cytochrome [Gemmatimonadota bacterium]
MMRTVTCIALFALVAPGGAAAQGWTWPERAENLQVLPEDFGGDRLQGVMTGFTRALGVRCSHCLVGEEGRPLSEFDFPSDENPNKETARTMLRMLGDIDEALKTVEPTGDRRVNMWCDTCHRGRPRPMTLQKELAEMDRARGGEAALARYDSLRAELHGRGAYDFGEGSLNGLGYELLQADRAGDAILVFERNAKLFPASGNAFDSLGEAWAAKGDTVRAIENYRRSLQLAPRNRIAARTLEELGAG